MVPHATALVSDIEQGGMKLTSAESEHSRTRLAPLVQPLKLVTVAVVVIVLVDLSGLPLSAIPANADAVGSVTVTLTCAILPGGTVAKLAGRLVPPVSEPEEKPAPP